MELQRIDEESNLHDFEDNGSVYRLHPKALSAWRSLKEAALRDGVEITIVSAYRSVAYQAEIIERKRKEGLSDSEIFAVVARPGFSEHHSGRALDLSSNEQTALTEGFCSTDAFRWLTEHASRFGFYLSYPQGNEYGIVFEPWHWMFKNG